MRPEHVWVCAQLGKVMGRRTPFSPHVAAHGFRMRWSVIRWSHTTSSGPISRAPLNVVTYDKRVNQITQWTPLLLIDLIKANRTLQKEVPPSSHYTFLDLHHRTSREWERRLQHTVFQSPPPPAVWSAYLYTQPRPVLHVDKLFSVVPCTRAYVLPMLQFLLDAKDYHSAFKLVDDTTKREMKQWLPKAGAWTTAATIGLSCTEWFLMPFLPVSVYLAVNFLAVFGTWAGLVQIHTPKLLGRISWRQCSFLHRYLHTDELMLVARILTHFEEVNEVNIRNFHHGKVREPRNLNTFDSNEYILEVPEPEENGMHRFFRAELTRRRMVINDLQEELNFIEFWLTHGEKFEWVEPDQDPAEQLKFLKRSPKSMVPANMST